MRSDTLQPAHEHCAEQNSWIRTGDDPFPRRTGEPSLATAILHTVVYADLFDYPLTVPEIWRYLVGRPASVAAVERCLQNHPPLHAHMDTVAPFWFLSGRAQVVGVRRQREAYSQLLWPAARSYARLIAAMPFVRLVAVSGALAMNNASGPHDDIDLLIVARGGRVWLARALTIAVVHLARRRGVELCPNYVLADTQLQLHERSLFAAHEMAQLVPLCGQEMYQRLWEHNPWIAAYLPNSSPQRALERDVGPWRWGGQRGLEMLLGGRLGSVLERWESTRKIARLRAQARSRGAQGTDFQPDRCKGQMVDHAAWTHEQYAQRLRSLGLRPEPGG